MDFSSFTSLLHDVGAWLSECNMVLMVLFVCSIIAVAVFIERLVYLRKVDVDTAALIIKLRQAIEEGNTTDAITICDAAGGAVARIVKAGLCKHSRPREQIENAMEMRGLVEIAKMEKHARLLSIIAHLAPLIGLLGTVLGFIKAFAEMRVSSLVEISATQIGAAMEYALITTAGGLVVAIPAVIGYNYIVSRIEGMVVEIQATSSEVVDLLAYGAH